MILLDFPVFFLTNWFEWHKEQQKWSSPMERAIYSLGLVTILWGISIFEIIEIFILKNTSHLQIPLIPGVIIGLFSMSIYKYIYINRKRYQAIQFSNSKFLKAGNKKGEILSIVFVLLFFILAYAIFMIFT